jgi:hypothetical protein
MTGEVTKVKNVGQEQEVTFTISNGQSVSFTGWERRHKVGDIIPVEVVRVFDRLVKSEKPTEKPVPRQFADPENLQVARAAGSVFNEPLTKHEKSK